jgi:lipid-binding SYLF domain-containing protein
MNKRTSHIMRTLLISAAIAGSGMLIAGCTATGHTNKATAAEQRAEIQAGFDATLTRLYAAAPESRELAQKAKGILIFPSVVGASFVVGAEYGKGELRVDGQHAGYFSTGGGSIGFQAGAQSQATVLLFMSQEALDNFRKSNGWTVGADANVAIATVGVNGRIDSATVNKPVIGFVLNNAGLAAGVSLQGDKIQKIDL